jgi:hypothetical protein
MSYRPEFGHAMFAQGKGSIINTASMSGVISNNPQPQYPGIPINRHGNWPKHRGRFCWQDVGRSGLEK